MLLSWYSEKTFYKFKPMEFTKLEKTSMKDFIFLLRDAKVGKPYLNTKMREFKHQVKKNLVSPFSIFTLQTQRESVKVNEQKAT